MKLWQKLWLLVSVMWVVVAALNVATILAFADEVEHGRAVMPALLGVGVPAALYALLAAWDWLARRR